MLEREAMDCWHRGLADALIVSGTGTGNPTSEVDVARVRAAVPEATVIVGSGVDNDCIGTLLGIADGAIVGTSLKSGGTVLNPVDIELVQQLMKASES
jgi:predicted TIM-barrel enzyme